MKTWLHPKAFLIAAACSLVMQFSKLPSTGADAYWVGRALGGVIGGGLFWGGDRFVFVQPILQVPTIASWRSVRAMLRLCS